MPPKERSKENEIHNESPLNVSAFALAMFASSMTSRQYWQAMPPKPGQMNPPRIQPPLSICGNHYRRSTGSRPQSVRRRSSHAEVEGFHG